MTTFRNAAKVAQMLKTGQTTQYSGEQDDGALQKGLTKSFTALTGGRYSGTTNVDLAHYAGGAGAIAFDNVAKTITDTGNGLAIFKTNDVIMTSATNNPGPFTVTTGNVAGTITCTGATFVTETPAGAITISKRAAYSNNCIRDENTGLIWTAYASGSYKYGTASDGKLPWTGQLYDAFALAAAANTAGLAGYSDWYIPDVFQLFNLCICEAPAVSLAAEFANWVLGLYVTSTTQPATTTSYIGLSLNTAGMGATAKTAENRVVLVRGG